MLLQVTAPESSLKGKAYKAGNREVNEAVMRNKKGGRKMERKSIKQRRMESQKDLITLGSQVHLYPLLQ